MGSFETTSLNALAYLTDTGYADEKETAVQATVGMKADLSKLVKGLSVNVDFSFDFNNVYVKKYGKQVICSCLIRMVPIRIRPLLVH